MCCTNGPLIVGIAILYIFMGGVKLNALILADIKEPEMTFPFMFMFTFTMEDSIFWRCG